MSKIINLRQVRKERARVDKRTAADENAARFGRTRALKLLEKARNAQAEGHLDAHQRESGGE